MSKYIIAITGASGSIYGKKIVELLLHLGHEVHLIISKTGMQVLSHELLISYECFIKEFNVSSNFHVEIEDDFFSPVASGSFKTSGMVILPCSMGTLGKIAGGSSDNLIIRAADVCLKEKRKLIICPRETPYNGIHLKNMLALNDAGACIAPISPGFYNFPKTLDDIINHHCSRVLDLLEIENPNAKRWGQTND